MYDKFKIRPFLWEEDVCCGLCFLKQAVVEDKKESSCLNVRKEYAVLMTRVVYRLLWSN